MAVLADADRVLTHSLFMQTNVEPLGLTKADLRAVVNALDDFLTTNAAAINAAIPQPARGALSTAQKAYLLTLVIQRRYQTGA